MTPLDFLRPGSDVPQPLRWLGLLGFLGFSGFQHPLGFLFFGFFLFFLMPPRRAD